MTNKEKFLALVSEENTDTMAKNKERIKNRAMLRESQQIALKVLLKLDDLCWTQKDLAAAMGVRPQQISKIVSGKENLTLETQVKLQTILDIPLLASYYDDKASKMEEMILSFEERVDKIVAVAAYKIDNYQKSEKSYTKTFEYPHLSVA